MKIKNSFGFVKRPKIFPTAIVSVVVSWTLATSAYGLTWVDEDNGDPLKFLKPSNPTYSSTFNILYDGYDPATMQVNSAVASFAFSDDGDSSYDEYVDIWLDATLFFDDIEVNGTHNNIPTSYDWRQNNVTGTLLTSLQDGVINYTVTVTSGDTYLKRAKLVAQGGYKPQPPPPGVPDAGSTAVLLGMGIVGMAAAARRQRLLG